MPYKIETMAVCLVTGGKNHYSGLCDFSAITHYTTIVAYALMALMGITSCSEIPWILSSRKYNNYIIQCVCVYLVWHHGVVKAYEGS